MINTLLLPSSLVTSRYDFKFSHFNYTIQNPALVAFNWSNRVIHEKQVLVRLVIVRFCLGVVRLSFYKFYTPDRSYLVWTNNYSHYSPVAVPPRINLLYGSGDGGAGGAGSNVWIILRNKCCRGLWNASWNSFRIHNIPGPPYSDKKW